MRSEPLEYKFAIVGIGCRFPGGASTPERFWRLLCDGVDAVTEMPKSRFDVDALYDSDPARPGRFHSRWGGFVEGIDQFDASFFGISPREAARMDPQHRFLLEVVWEAFEDGGQRPASLAGTRTGVFVGISTHDYGDMQIEPANHHLIDSHVNIGSANSIAANRISYALDLRGPSMVVDTACSSSLTALHLACHALAERECDLAVIAGVNLMVTPGVTLGFAKALMLSPDGRCRAFDSRANGYVRSEGAGAVVIKPLSAAVAAGDPIYAVVRGTAINQDGRTNGISVPSGDAQAALIRHALEKAGIEPGDVHYVEAHGTGTPVGDPIEVNAIGLALADGRPGDRPCLIGSVKTNIGHLEAGSGMPGLIKAALALKHRVIPPSIHLRTVNPAIDLDALRLRIPTSLEPWPESSGPAIAGVNSFGFGGANAHALLEAPPRAQPTPATALAHETERAHVLSLSARSANALREVALRYEERLGTMEAPLADVCSTAALRRDHHEHRIAVVGRTREEIAECLSAFRVGDARSGLSVGRAPRGGEPKIAFVFSGMGPQWWGMGRQLMHEEAVFRETVEECDRLLRPLAPWRLLDELAADEAHSKVARADLAQTTNFVIQVALAELWRSWGVIPDAVVGHSAGEIAASYIAGTMPLADAIRVAFHRGRLQYRAAGMGKMLAVGLSHEDAARMLDWCADRVAVAAVNAPESVTLSGDARALEQIDEQLRQQQRFSRFLPVDVPYHSPLMEPIRDELLESLEGLRVEAPSIPIVSEVTGDWMTEQRFDGDYWWANIRRPVLFGPAMDRLIADGFTTFVEVGPHPVLAGAVTECLSHRGQSGIMLPSLRRKEPEREIMLRSLGALYTVGRRVSWQAVHRSRAFVALPTYPWQHERHWFDGASATNGGAAGQPAGVDSGHPLLGHRLRSARPTWETELRDSRLAYLEGHGVNESAVFPGAGYLEAALAVARRMTPEARAVLRQVSFHRAFVLDDRDGAVLQFHFDPATSSFSLQSAAKIAPDSWTLHASGRIASGAVTSAPAENYGDLAGIRRRCPTEVGLDVCYGAFASRGYRYSDAFRTIRALWLGEREALARVEFPEGAALPIAAYEIHPALLDAGLQLGLAAFGLVGGTAPVGDKALVMPVFAERVEMYSALGERFWAHAVATGGENAGIEQVSVDVDFMDDEGRVGLSLRGLRCRIFREQQRLNAGVEDGFLYEVAWDRAATVPAPAAAGVAASRDAVAAIEASGDTLAADPTWTTYHRQAIPRIEAIATRFVHDALRRLGWNAARDRTLPMAAVMTNLGVLAKYERFFTRLVAIANDEGPAGDSANSNLADSEPVGDAIEALRREHPDCAIDLDLLSHCGARLADLLRGDADPREVLFAPEGLEKLSRFYHESIVPARVGSLAADAIAALRAGAREPAALRVIEVGAGTGGTTAHVLPRLGPIAEYLFTDVSPYFLASASARFSGASWLRTATLDIESELATQRMPEGSYDVVVAGLAIHAVTDIRSALRNVRRLLAPGGVLVMIEATRPLRSFDVIFGITDGWWHFTDSELRPHTLLSRSAWNRVLADCGFTNVGAGNNVFDDDSVMSLVLAVAEEQAPVAARPHSLILFGDRGGVASRLRVALRAAGHRCTIAYRGDAFRDLGDDTYEIAASGPEGPALLFDPTGPAALSATNGIVYLWALDAPTSDSLTANTLMTWQQLACGGALELALAADASRSNHVPRLWLVTAGAQSAGEESHTPNVAQSSLWGLGRVIATELPKLRCRLLDLSAECTADDVDAFAAQLVHVDSESSAEAQESEFALRTGARFVSRLRRLPQSGPGLPERIRQESPNDRAFHLVSESPGALETLALRASPASAPRAGEVAIRVRASALNFKDIMLALGMFPPAAADETFTGLALGLDCAGVVEECGEGVTRVRPGDEVVAVAPAALGSRVVTREQFVAPKPPRLTMEQAAGIPIAFMTAHYALDKLARLVSGERVLIHAAAGGVGLAAIAIARRIGAEIFATAGTMEKRAYLASLGIRHVLDSRSPEFGREVLGLTGGEGIDVVLNSLAGDAIEQGLSTLRSGGRFIEIGKRDIYANTPLGMLSLRRNLAFFTVDIDRMLYERPDYTGTLLGEMVELLTAGELDALPHTCFDLAEAEQAFRLMAGARHVGKVVVAPRGERYAVKARPDAALFVEDGAYLVTGGLGGFGVTTAAWMLRHGAGHVVLMSRSGTPTPEIVAALDALRRSAGPRLSIVRGDVSIEEDISRVLSEIRARGAPLRGVIHAAMVLDDAALAELDAERMRAVLAPKVAGAWNVHRLTCHDPIDVFVMFSSIASVLGNARQGNYAAANAFLDSLAAHRRGLGLPALTVNWGMLDDVGYVSRHDAVARSALRRGFQGIAPDEALGTLERLLRHDVTRVIAARISWSALSSLDPSTPVTKALLREVIKPAGASDATGTPTGDGQPLLEMLRAAPPDRRRALLQENIVRKVAKVLAASADRVESDRPLTELGFDSLMAVELLTALRRDPGVELPAVTILQGVSVTQLAERVLALLTLDAATTSAGQEAASAPAAARDAATASAPSTGSVTLEASGAKDQSTRPFSNGTVGSSAPAYPSADRPVDSIRWTASQRAVRGAFTLLLRTAARVSVEGLENVPRSGPLILAINHVSLMDPVLVMSLLPRSVVPLAAERLQQSPVFRWLVDAAHGIYVRRGEGDREALDRCVEVLRAGGALLVAPEGTRSRTGGLLRGETGIAHLASESGAPVLPVGVFGQEHIAGNARRLTRTAINVRFGQPILFAREARTPAKLRADTDTLMHALAALLPAQYRGEYGRSLGA